MNIDRTSSEYRKGVDREFADQYKMVRCPTCKGFGDNSKSALGSSTIRSIVDCPKCYGRGQVMVER